MIKHFTHITFIFSILFSASLSEGWAQAYRIEAKINGLQDTTLILGHYSRSNTQFIPKDTAKADATGKVVFEGKENLPGGLYVILFPGNSKWLELVYSGKEHDIRLDTDTTDLVGKIQVQGSPENEVFYAYQKRLIADSRTLKALIDEKSPELAQKQKETKEAFQKYKKSLLDDQQALFTTSLLKMAAEPDVPPAPKLANGKTDSLWAFHYYRNHYWDQFDFSDKRIMNTPFLEPKLNTYLHNLLVQTPDSIILAADALIKKTEVNPDLRQYVIYYITNQYENPKTVGTEGVWVHMAKKYYLGGEMDITADTKKRIAEKVRSMERLLVNKPFPTLELSQPDGKLIKANDLPANYSVLFFYAPTCGHCKESAPKLKEFYDSYKEKGVQVIAIATERNKEEWTNFIDTYHLAELKNAMDTKNTVNFYQDFDVVSTPTVYVLDKEHKIIARKMPVEQLGDFLDFYQRKMEKK
ncbi:peroxiredoxin [Dyadobacter jejuensis]|uniref:Peroxiredoxin n=1 Tax=Dyadobacter jejuensis TaxID=1082580 RepID=A0A316AHN4_9BACT|nr:TlpA family protein disulfide reductase [Dyadobacter jejuensis]PWJ57216.1 peroxiredoxin [Dyadobacter jejuensis]